MAQELSDDAKERIDEIIDKMLIGGEDVRISLIEFDDDDLLISDADFMALYLTTRLAAKGSKLRVERVKVYYFDFGPGLGPILGPVCYLGLVDDATQTRRLFILGKYNPGMEWMREQNSGPQFERARQFHESGERHRVQHKAVPAAQRAYVAPLIARVRAYVESRELTPDQKYDIDEVLKYTPWEKMELKNLLYIAIALDTTLEEIAPIGRTN